MRKVIFTITIIFISYMILLACAHLMKDYHNFFPQEDILF
jgi:hypothetical protein